MLLKKSTAGAASESQVTPESVYLNRRGFLKGTALGTSFIAASTQAGLLDFFSPRDTNIELAPRKALAFLADKPTTELTVTPERKAISHNNFYEFGTKKTDPVENSQGLRTEPWTIQVDGEVAKPGKIDVWELINSTRLVERIYRMRCVEAWSMVIPWVGIELGMVLKQFHPTSKAKFVAFETLYDPNQMPGQKNRFTGGGIQYPYVEGLRIDEAMNPLTLLSVGAYGKTLLPQNGAPIRLVVPWKYGFKGIKSIVRIHLMEAMPTTSWNLLAPSEYGFYANVNPKVDHPRWSQASERFIGPGGVLDVTRQPTRPFNGYGEQVAFMYSGMNLSRYF